MTETLEEKKLTELVGKENPFRVPEGYFDTLPNRVNTRIAWRKRERKMWRWAAAAIVTGCIGTAGLVFLHEERMSDAEAYEDAMEMLMDYNMVNNLEITNYITEAE